MGLPLLSLLVFLGAQIINFDSLGWSSGFSHPWIGWDHLVTMLAVGIWAAQLRGQAIWMLPLAFVGVMGLGGVAGAEGFSIPHVEGIILLSCAVFGVLITRKVRFSTKVNVLIVAFFAFFHGFAHGHEISASASLISYVLGFMLATLLLHGAGILVAKLVVFAVTFMLTMMFSNAALAKADDVLYDAKIKPPAIDMMHIAADTGYQFAGVTITGGTLVAVGGSGAGKDCGAADLMVRSDHAAVFKASPLNSHNARIKACSDSQGMTANRVSYPTPLTWRDDELSDDGLTNQTGSSFKHYFPDINHTPGSHFSSNGVGLNSPPVAIFPVLASQDSPYSHKTSIPCIEARFLRCNIAKFGAGNPFTKTSGEVRQDGSSFYRRNLGHAINIFSLALTCLRNPSNEGTQLRPVFQKFRLSAGNGQSVKLSIKNNNDITRRNNDESI